MGLGGYPGVSLAEARKAAGRNYFDVEAGRDPRRRSRKATASNAAPSVTRRAALPATATLGEYVERTIEAKRGTWKDARAMEGQWRSSLKHAGALLQTPVAEVTAGDALAILEPLAADRPSVATVLRSRLGEAIARAIVEGACTANPFVEVKPFIAAQMPKRGHEHYAALDWREVPAAFAKLKATGTVKALAAAWQVANAVRPKNAAEARYSQIDGETWTVPAEGMKGGVAHRVPLSEAALGVLAEVRERHKHAGDFLFPGRAGSIRRPRLIEACRDVGLGHTTAHGFRASFTDWHLTNNPDIPREVAERALAHVEGGVRGAYARSDLFEPRVELMARWGAFIDG